MNWEYYAIWHYYDWTQILFVLLISIEMTLAVLYAKNGRRLFSSKSEIAYKVASVQNDSQKISSPIRSVSTTSYTRTYSENDKKSDPQPKKDVFSVIIHECIIKMSKGDPRTLCGPVGVRLCSFGLW
jgi:hypothetical protein